MAGALSHMETFPLLQRPYEYRHGGAVRRVRARGRRPQGGFSLGDIKRAASKAVSFVQKALPYAKMALPYVKQALPYAKLGLDELSKYDSGLANSMRQAQEIHDKLKAVRDLQAAGGALRRRRPAVRGGAIVLRRPPRPHVVRAHTSHTKFGEPIRVRAHMAAGMARRRSRRGGFSFNDFLSGIGSVAKTAIPIAAELAPIAIRALARGQGLLAPAGGLARVYRSRRV